MRLSKGYTNFVDTPAWQELLSRPAPDLPELRDILAHSLNLAELDLQQTSRLLLVDDPLLRQEVQNAASELKSRVYGNRIVLFAPLYIGNHCLNNCAYCGFRSGNHAAKRATLSHKQLVAQCAALEDAGHKRLILVFGEHPDYSPDFIADTVSRVYAVKSGAHGEIRRLNINAAPLDPEGYALVKSAGIGTWQVFQETYHQPTYRRFHPPGSPKHDFDWRLDALARAFEGGVDDVGIGALFGLYDWRFEVLGLVAHSLNLRQRFGVGPHTISFPRLKSALGADITGSRLVADEDFAYLVAVLRLAVPYTGLILTAREPEALRRKVLAYGVSQIDGGTRLELEGYTNCEKKQDLSREQFLLADERSLDQVICELIEDGYLPSFCTACYRIGRTGEHFMEFAIPGFIKRFCTPNACLTLKEYLEDYGSLRAVSSGEKLIAKELATISDPTLQETLTSRLNAIRQSGRRGDFF